MSIMNHYNFSSRIWRWPGQGGWHFVTLPKELFNEIRQSYGKGMVPIQVIGSNPSDQSISSIEWRATLFPHLQSESYILAIKKSIRPKLQTYEGDFITITFNIL